MGETRLAGNSGSRLAPSLVVTTALSASQVKAHFDANK